MVNEMAAGLDQEQPVPHLRACACACMYMYVHSVPLHVHDMTMSHVHVHVHAYLHANNAVCMDVRTYVEHTHTLHVTDEVAEWLRRWTANPLCSARVGSNPILVGFFLRCFFFVLFLFFVDIEVVTYHMSKTA